MSKGEDVAREPMSTPFGTSARLIASFAKSFSMVGGFSSLTPFVRARAIAGALR
jgi:hypothetical protein